MLVMIQINFDYYKMSSQGLNATTYSGYILSSNETTSRLPLRDAQDFTLLKKRTGITNAFFDVGLSQSYPVLQSNQNRLSVRFGVLLCRNGAGGTCNGPFPDEPLVGISRG
jgi:hypothetical protein